MRAVLAATLGLLLLAPMAVSAPVTLTIEHVPAGVGRTTSSPPGIDCPGDCAESLEPQSVSLLAYAPSSGYEPNGWTGCDFTNPNDPSACSVNLQNPRTVTVFWRDALNPSIAFGGPSGTVSGTILFNPTVSDNSGTVDHVSFYVDRATPGDLPFAVDSDPAGGYTATLDTTTLADGEHTFEQIAYDAAGNAALASRALTIANGPRDTSVGAPVFVSPSPADGATTSGANLQYTFTKDSDVPDANVTCRVDSGAATPCTSPYTVDVGALGDGGHSLTVAVTDTSTNQASASRTFRVARPSTPGPAPAPTATPSPPPLSLSAKRTLPLKASRRRLRVQYSTPSAGVAKFELLRGTDQLVRASKAVKGGAGSLTLRVPASVRPGRSVLRLTFAGRTKRRSVTLTR